MESTSSTRNEKLFPMKRTRKRKKKRKKKKDLSKNFFDTTSPNKSIITHKKKMSKDEKIAASIYREIKERIALTAERDPLLVATEPIARSYNWRTSVGILSTLPYSLPLRVIFVVLLPGIPSESFAVAIACS